jgi:uncharacterized damage-inducible protein DinB
MKARIHLSVLALCGLATAALAQGSAPVSDALRSNAQRAAKNLVAAAEEMPSDKYGYKPTPAQMSVGDIVGHLAGGNDFLCSSISGIPAPKRSDMAKDATKDKLVARLKESFQFCESSLAKVNDSNLSAKVPFFGKSEVTRAEAILAIVEDWGDHYSQLANYLRLNGLLPPTAKKA